MATYSKVDKDTSTYIKRDKTDRGWFRTGWFSEKGWLSDIYTKINKAIATYAKTDKDISSYTKIDKDTATYTKVDK